MRLTELAEVRRSYAGTEGRKAALRGEKTGIFERGRVVTRGGSRPKSICDWRVKKYVEVCIFRGFGMYLVVTREKMLKPCF